MFFMRQRLYEFANKPNRYLANLLRNKAPSQSIPCVRDSAGLLQYDNKVINDTFKAFYKQLYTSQFNFKFNSSLGLDMADFFSRLDLPNISDTQRTDLSKPLSASEIMKGIQLLPNNKTPGPDSLT